LLAHNTNLLTVSCYPFYCAQIISKLIIFRISRLCKYYSLTERICSRGYIYNTDAPPTKEETLTINWVGYYVAIVFSEFGSFAEAQKELRNEAPMGVAD
jgi:hypothetical protein